MTAPGAPRLSRPQLASVVEATGHVNIWTGAIRSGKTIASILAWLLAVNRATGRGELVLVGRTRDSAWRNVLAVLQAGHLFGPVIASAVVGKHGSATVSVLGRTVYVLGVNDVRAEEKVRGMTVELAYVDEVTTISLPFFQQLLGRMSVPGAQLFGTTNPDSPAHWLKTKYLDDLPPAWRTWTFAMDDNDALSDEYKAQKRAEFTGLFYRRFILGEWVAAEGAVYADWNPDRHVIPWENMPVIAQYLAVGVDYGTTNPTSAILLGITEGHDRLVLMDEFRHDPTARGSEGQPVRLTDAQQSTLVREWIRAPHMPGRVQRDVSRVVVDPAAASFRVQLKLDGVATVPAHNDVMYGIGRMASLISAGRLVVTDRCRGFIAEAPGYSWDDKASEKGEERPVKLADHSLDAARYAVVTTETYWTRLMGGRFAA